MEEKQIQCGGLSRVIMVHGAPWEGPWEARQAQVRFLGVVTSAVGKSGEWVITKGIGEISQRCSTFQHSSFMNESVLAGKM